MDVKREGASRKRIIRRTIAGVVLVTAVIGVSVAVARLKPAVPTVDAGPLWPDTVRRGEMLRQVRGLGTLVPENVLYIPADTDGRVSKINVRPGAAVRPDTVILELENPDVKLAAVNAEFDMKAAEANLIDLRVRLESQSFDQKSLAATVNSDYKQANLQADRDRKLASAGLIADLQRDMSTTKAEELSTRNKIELDRAKIVDASVQAQLAAQQVKVDQLKAVYQLKKQQVEQLRVRAGTTGILQALGPPAAQGASAPPLEVGQKVAAGTILAKIAQPEKLKAELKITETEAKDIAMGQPAEIDTRNGIIPGKVIRIDPASINGTVTVDVALTGALPQGARPDLSVDGTIQLEKLTNILFVGRPVFGQPNAEVMIFKYEPDGKSAVKTKVKLGRASVNTIEVVSGLREGDKVILSDMNAYDSHDRIRISGN